MTSRLIEVVLSSTPASSPLPLTSVHSIETGQLLTSFKSPPPPSTTISTTTSNNSNGKGKQVDSTGGGGEGSGQTMSWVEGSNGVAGCLVGLGGKDGRALLNVWNLTRESTISRLHPPTRLSVLSASPTGAYLVGGTPDGRIWIWELSTGLLLATLDAHYRKVSAVEWFEDESGFVSASEDAGISVWSIGRILNSTPMNPPTPFTTLSDHTLGITAIKTGKLGSFPNCRVFSASKDGTVKIWDLSTTPASLLTTFEFPAPVQHLVVDPPERFFFVSIPTTTTTSISSEGGGGGGETVKNGSKVLRVNLYRESNDKTSSSIRGGIVPVGGTGSIGELERIEGSDDEPGMSYTLSEPISALHLSSHSPTLLVSTSNSSQIHLLSLLSLLPNRIISPPPSSTPYGGLSFLTTFLYSPPSNGSTAGDSSTVGVQREIASTLGRSVVGVEERERGGKGGRYVWGRVAESGVKVEELVQPVRGLDPLPTFSGGSDVRAVTPMMNGAGGGGTERETIERLERELEGYRKGLEKVRGVNQRIWKSVVEGTIGGSASN